MEQYEAMRHFADSWGLLFMTIVFVVVVIYTLRPGSRSTHDDAANIPFRHEDRPNVSMPGGDVATTSLETKGGGHG